MRLDRSIFQERKVGSTPSETFFANQTHGDTQIENMPQSTVHRIHRLKFGESRREASRKGIGCMILIGCFLSSTGLIHKLTLTHHANRR